MELVSGIEISARRAIRRSLICYVRRNRGGLRLKSWNGRRKSQTASRFPSGMWLARCSLPSSSPSSFSTSLDAGNAPIVSNVQRSRTTTKDEDEDDWGDQEEPLVPIFDLSLLAIASERVHQRLHRSDMCVDACLDRKRRRRLDCVAHLGVIDREISRLGPLGTVFKPAQFGDEIAPRDDTAVRGRLLDFRAQVDRYMESHCRNNFCSEPGIERVVQLVEIGADALVILVQHH